jgi:hypothetical protein
VKSFTLFWRFNLLKSVNSKFVFSILQVLIDLRPSLDIFFTQFKNSNPAVNTEVGPITKENEVEVVDDYLDLVDEGCEVFLITDFSKMFNLSNRENVYYKIRYHMIILFLFFNPKLR